MNLLMSLFGKIYRLCTNKDTYTMKREKEREIEWGTKKATL